MAFLKCLKGPLSKPKKWVAKTWSGWAPELTTLMWSDFEGNVYSDSTSSSSSIGQTIHHKKLNKSTGIWEDNSWSGSYTTNIEGGDRNILKSASDIWSVNSRFSKAVKYDNQTHQFPSANEVSMQIVSSGNVSMMVAKKPWWSDGINTYMNGQIRVKQGTTTSTIYVSKILTLNSSGNIIFEDHTWNWSDSSDRQFSGQHIWRDGSNVYLSIVSSSVYYHYVLDKSTDTWIPKVWNGFTDFDGDKIWSDGIDIYMSNGSNQYILDRSSDTFIEKVWDGFSPSTATWIWSDGRNTYYSYVTNNEQYVLVDE